MAYMRDSTGRRLDSFPVVGAESLPKRRINVGAKARHLGSATLSNGTDTGLNVRLRQTSPIDVHGLIAAFGNFYNPTGAEAPGLNDITLRAAIEFNQNGPGSGSLVFWPLFFRGQRDVTIQPGGIVESDYCGFDTVAGANWWLRIYLTVPAGGKWPTGPLARLAHNDGIQVGTTQTDMTTSGTFPALSGDTATYGPLGLYTARRDLSTPFVALVGDSVINGSADTPVLDNGFAVRAVQAAAKPYVLIGQPGTRADQFTSYAAQYRLRQVADCTSAIVAFGANDLGSSATQAVLQASLLTNWRLLAQQGMKVFACTITPRTTSTDAWATLANQTPHSANATRVAVNDWIRAGAPIDPTTKAAVAVGTAGALVAGQAGHWLAGFFDTADRAESSRNSGLWKISSGTPTTDGLHPTAAIHALMAAAVDASKLT